MKPAPRTAEAIATVVSCTYTAGAGRAIAFGLPTTKHFRITYNYWAGDRLHTGEFASAKPIPQGTLFPVTYDPDAPHLHAHTENVSRRSIRSVQIVLGLGGSLLLSLLWWFILHARR